MGSSDILQSWYHQFIAHETGQPHAINSHFLMEDWRWKKVTGSQKQPGALKQWVLVFPRSLTAQTTLVASLYFIQLFTSKSQFHFQLLMNPLKTAERTSGFKKCEAQLPFIFFSFCITNYIRDEFIIKKFGGLWVSFVEQMFFYFFFIYLFFPAAVTGCPSSGLQLVLISGLNNTGKD